MTNYIVICLKLVNDQFYITYNTIKNKNQNFNLINELDNIIYNTNDSYLKINQPTKIIEFNIINSNDLTIKDSLKERYDKYVKLYSQAKVKMVNINKDESLSDINTEIKKLENIMLNVKELKLKIDIIPMVKNNHNPKYENIIINQQLLDEMSNYQIIEKKIKEYEVIIFSRSDHTKALTKASAQKEHQETEYEVLRIQYNKGGLVKEHYQRCLNLLKTDHDKYSNLQLSVLQFKTPETMVLELMSYLLECQLELKLIMDQYESIDKIEQLYIELYKKRNQLLQIELDK